MPDEGDPLGGMLDHLVEVPFGTAEETVYTCLRHLAEEGIADGLTVPGAARLEVSETPTKEVFYINECQHKVEQDLVGVETKSGWPKKNAWNALKLALNIPGFECPEGGRAKELREIARKVGVSRVTHLTSSGAAHFSRELHADIADPELSAREKLMADLGVWEKEHPRFRMRYNPDTEEAKLFTSRWLPRVFVRVLLWLSALETCIEDKTGPYENETVQNAARRVLSRWYQWFAADGLKDRVPPFTLGNETGGAPGEKRGAPVSVHGLGGTAGTGQEAKQRRTGGVNVGGFAASAAVPKDDIGDKGIPVLPGEAGDNADGTAGLTGLPDIPFSRSLDNPTAPPGAANSPGAGAEMDDIQHRLPEVH